MLTMHSAGLAGAFIDREFESKGLDFIDKEKAKYDGASLCFVSMVRGLMGRVQRASRCTTRTTATTASSERASWTLEQQM